MVDWDAGIRTNQGGWKSYEKFRNGNGVCYVTDPDTTDSTAYTRQELIEIAFDNPDLARLIFDLLEWQHAGTVLSDLLERDIYASPQSYGLEQPPDNPKEAERALKNFDLEDSPMG